MQLSTSYWYTKPKWGSNDTRPNFLLDTYTGVNWGNFVHTRTFGPSVLNEARFAVHDIFFEQTYPKLSEIINTPAITTDDGLSIPLPFENIYHEDVRFFVEIRGRLSGPLSTSKRPEQLTWVA